MPSRSPGRRGAPISRHFFLRRREGQTPSMSRTPARRTHRVLVIRHHHRAHIARGSAPITRDSSARPERRSGNRPSHRGRSGRSTLRRRRRIGAAHDRTPGHRPLKRRAASRLRTRAAGSAGLRRAVEVAGQAPRCVDCPAGADTGTANLTAPAVCRRPNHPAGPMRARSFRTLAGRGVDSRFTIETWWPTRRGPRPGG